MIEWLATLPHCSFYGRPWLTALHLIGNAMVVAAYMAIPIAIEIVRRRRHLHWNALAAMFALFIFLCGLGHALNTVAILTANITFYWAKSVNDILTGIVSIATAVYAFVLIPTMIKIPMPTEYELMEKVLIAYRETEQWRQFGKPGENRWT